MIRRLFMALLVGAGIVALDRPDDARRAAQEAGERAGEAASMCRAAPSLCPVPGIGGR